MAKAETEPRFQKEVGSWGVAGGIVAGLLGLLTANYDLFVAGVAILGGGYYLRKHNNR